jgi:uncharacterized protein (TIGR02996 family)
VEETAVSALFQAILESPEDDEVRLVYSDWLEENGQAERAEFIRASIELTRLPRYAPRAREVRHRARELLRTHGANWDTEVRLTGSFGQTTSDSYRRGFIEAMTFRTAARFIRCAGRLLKLAPIRHLEIEAPWFRHASWKRCGAVSRLRSLKLGRYASQKWDPNSLKEVLAHPKLANLTALDVGENYFLGEQWGEVLAAATHLTNLRTLDLAGNGIDREGLEALADAAFMPSLRALNLSGNNLDVRAMATLAFMPQFAGLTDLRLGQIDEFDFEEENNYLGDDGLRQLIASPNLKQLSVLSLFETGITDAGLIALAAWPGLRSLTYLDLSYNTFTDAGMEALANSAHLANLRGLVVWGDSLTEAGVRAVINSPHLTGLVEVSLGEKSTMSPALWRALEERFGAGLDDDGDWSLPEPGSEDSILE